MSKTVDPRRCHIDHGKIRLFSCLTSTGPGPAEGGEGAGDHDRARVRRSPRPPVGKGRGIVDVPGARTVSVRGRWGGREVDIVLLVGVAADEGVMPKRGSISTSAAFSRGASRDRRPQQMRQGGEAGGWTSRRGDPRARPRDVPRRGPDRPGFRRHRRGAPRTGFRPGSGSPPGFPEGFVEPVPPPVDRSFSMKGFGRWSRER